MLKAFVIAAPYKSLTGQAMKLSRDPEVFAVGFDCHL